MPQRHSLTTHDKPRSQFANPTLMSRMVEPILQQWPNLLRLHDTRTRTLADRQRAELYCVSSLVLVRATVTSSDPRKCCERFLDVLPLSAEVRSSFSSSTRRKVFAANPSPCQTSSITGATTSMAPHSSRGYKAEMK